MGRTERSKNKKPSKAKVLEWIAKEVGHDAINLAGDEFPEKFYAISMDEGRHIVVRRIDSSGLVVISSMTAVANSVYSFAHGRKDYADFVPDVDTAKKVANNWIALQADKPPVPMPKAFVWADETGLAFSRLPWKKGEDGPTPTWGKISARMSNFHAFMGFIGSMFDETATHQQYVWCYGGGGNGKSAIDRVLERIFGMAYRAAQPPGRGQNTGFWLRSLLGKKLVVFPDCGDKKFPASGLFKSMCANDALQLEEKNGPTVSARLGCRYIFMSNELPELSSEDADSRRVIFCELGKPSAEELRPSFEADLWSESGAFMTDCMRVWDEIKKSHGGTIPTDKSEISSLVEDLEMHHADNLDFYFDINFTSKNESISPIMFQRCVSSFYKYRGDQLDFVRWLQRTHGIKKKSVRLEDGRIVKQYVGLFPKQTKMNEWSL